MATPCFAKVWEKLPVRLFDESCEVSYEFFILFH